MKKVIFILVFVLAVTNVFAELPLGEKPPVIDLKGKIGERVDGTPWSSNELVGKVWVVFYADPDESDLNDPAADSIKAKRFFRKKNKVQLQIVNYAANMETEFLLFL